MRDAGSSPHGRVVLGMLVWSLLLALGSALTSTPFDSEPSADLSIDWRRATEALLAGAFVALVGGMLYMFASRTRGGPEFIVTAIGFVVIVAGAVPAISSLLRRGIPMARRTGLLVRSMRAHRTFPALTPALGAATELPGA